MSLLSSSRFGGGGSQQQNTELESQIVNTVKQVILFFCQQFEAGVNFQLSEQYCSECVVEPLLNIKVVNIVCQDMEAVDKLGQWVFSCYSPAKDCASVPGMDDICPEELRMEAYQVNFGY